MDHMNRLSLKKKLVGRHCVAEVKFGSRVMAETLGQSRVNNISLAITGKSSYKKPFYNFQKKIVCLA